jgi:heterodisulfide reductase subunit A
MVAWVNEVLCQGCGVCVADCPAGAIVQPGYTDEQIFAEIEGLLMRETCP